MAHQSIFNCKYITWVPLCFNEANKCKEPGLLPNLIDVDKNGFLFYPLVLLATVFKPVIFGFVKK